MVDKNQNVQDVFLNHIRKTKTPVTVYLICGVKLQGIITWFDNFSMLLRRDGHTQLYINMPCQRLCRLFPSRCLMTKTPARKRRTNKELSFV